MYYFDPQGLEIAPGTGVIVETARGVEYGDCVQGNMYILYTHQLLLWKN